MASRCLSLARLPLLSSASAAMSTKVRFGTKLVVTLFFPLFFPLNRFNLLLLPANLSHGCRVRGPPLQQDYSQSLPRDPRKGKGKGNRVRV